MNFLHRIFSISSACLTPMLTRIELIEPSIKTFSFSFRLTIKGVNNNSLLLRTSTSGLLCLSTTWELKLSRHMAAVNVDLPAFRYGFNVAAIRKTKSRNFVYILRIFSTSPLLLLFRTVAPPLTSCVLLIFAYIRCTYLVIPPF